jgi:hypothetical protein
MVTARQLAFVSALFLAAPAVPLHAQVWRGPSVSVSIQSAYDEGFRRGQTVGERDGRQGVFNFSIAADFRRGDIGWSARVGARDRYQQDFRAGFEAGYRQAYDRFDVRRERGGPPPWARGRARGFEGNDLAFTHGYNDGYEEGLNDGRRRHTNDPTDESRYRNADRGYERFYGARETYRVNYRHAFIDGYEAGYRDGRVYR